MKSNSIELKNITKKIKKTQVLTDINLKFQAGETYGLTGINGSGKTMILRLICGLIKPTTGTVMMGDKKVKLGGTPVSIGALIENPSFVNEFTGTQNLDLLGLLSSDYKQIKGEINVTLERVGLDPEDRRLYHKYSLGMKQRLGIAQAIIGTPQVVVLDEPTNALDEEGLFCLRKVIKNLQAYETTIIVASHDKEFLQGITTDKNIIRLENGIVKSQTVEIG